MKSITEFINKYDEFICVISIGILRNNPDIGRSLGYVRCFIALCEITHLAKKSL